MAGTAVGRANRRGLAGEAADRIREAIFAGSLPPGSALREVELASSIGISRGAVREGLAVLTREGLIRTEWHRGTKVIDVTEADAEEIYAVRAALERLAAVTAAEHATEQTLDDLDHLVDEMATRVDQGAPADELLALDIEFHDRIYHAAANTRLLAAWQGIRSQVYLFQLTRVRLGHEQYRTIVVDEHRELVTLLRSKNAAELARTATEHVTSAGRILVRQLAAGGHE